MTTLHILRKTRTVLERVELPGPPTYMAPVEAGEARRDHIVTLDAQVWRDMGQPSTITVTVEPGDRLNAEAEAAGMPADRYIAVEHFDARASGHQAGEKGTP